jgi:hypothetical protein
MCQKCKIIVELDLTLFAKRNCFSATIVHEKVATLEKKAVLQIVTTVKAA